MNTTEPVGLGKVRGNADPQVRRPAISGTSVSSMQFNPDGESGSEIMMAAWDFPDLNTYLSCTPHHRGGRYENRSKPQDYSLHLMPT